MSRGRFHDEPFDEGTLTKLEIFERYAKEWLPVFLASPRPPWPAVHVFDFFAGPGTDSEGNKGSPLRLLDQVRGYADSRRMQGLSKVRIQLHFFDKSPEKTERLEANVRRFGALPENVHIDIRSVDFETAFEREWSTLRDPRAAKLLFIDQFGVGQVDDEVFKKLVTAPSCDFLFFIASSTLHRFAEHSAIKQKIERPDDYFHVHRKVLDYYRGIVPEGQTYYLAPFSLKKRANIYGVIFGSGHPKGISKFLSIAWSLDKVHGEADFDIDRENITVDAPMLPMRELQPRKLLAFERTLEAQIRRGELLNELDVVRVCFEHGVRENHATPVLQRLRDEGVILVEFRSPQLNHRGGPRPIKMTR